MFTVRQCPVNIRVQRQQREELGRAEENRVEFMVTRDRRLARDAREISRSMFVNVGGHDPLADVTFDVPAVIAAHHDYPSGDMLGHLLTEA